ncbi:MAG TPA: prepilin-type N-terminal cleavage/methylation domain-containing protein [Acidimicrobiales bacterium]|nr:prepilin-type N-terminal cleavage/methylation domain-containing protein [Acidimicrobiales bacterium]
MGDRLREKRNDGGFTLIELLIVIIILAILAAIVVFAVGGTSKNAAVASCNADAKSVETAVEAFKGQMGTYPNGIGPLTSTTSDKAGNTVGPWLRSIPGTAHYTVSVGTTGDVYVNGSNYDTSNQCSNAS